MRNDKEKGCGIMISRSSDSIIRLFDYSIISRDTCKTGFTLIELLVVIGIIGTLSAILVSSFSGGTEAARAAKCLTNMRNLAQAAIGLAARERNPGDTASNVFPAAGSHACLGRSGSDVVYRECHGWISWLSMNNEYGGNGSQGGGYPKSFVQVENMSAYSVQGDPKATFAITNGTLWQALGGNREVYVCPEHVRIVQGKGRGRGQQGQQGGSKGLQVNWSYVMNAYFGYDSSDGSKAVTVTDSTSTRVTLNSPRLDRTLLFAELPFQDHDFNGSLISTDFSTSAGPENDCVLQYKGGTIDGDTFNNNWKGKAESIAFNHKNGKRWCAHVAFADGHTEKLMLPKGGGGLTREQLTALLCGDDTHNAQNKPEKFGGKDIAFDGKTYSKLKN